MTAMRDRAIATVALLLALAPRLAAQPATAGVPVASPHLAEELNPSIVADGLGGAYVGFKLPMRSPSLPAEIVISHLLPSAYPDPEWVALPMTPVGSLPQGTPPGPTRLLMGPAGRALAFADYGSATGTLNLIREVAADGAEPGYPGFKATYSYSVFAAQSRADGGALVLSKVPGNTNVLVSVVTAAGTGTEIFYTLEIGNGAQSAVPSDRIAPVPSSSGVIAAMQFPNATGTVTGTDLVAVRFDAAGAPLWIGIHRLVTAATRDQADVVAATDGADGMFMAWRDTRTLATGSDLYGTRMLANGTVATGWTAGGKALCTATGEQTAPAIASDDAGGAWLAWVDGRDTLGTDIYYTHVLANGAIAAGFPAGGKALCAAAGAQGSVQLARDGSGGCFAAWLDPRDGEVDLYGQHFDTAGNPTAGWTANGSPLCTDPTAQGSPAIERISTGRAVVVWNDSRLGFRSVYALLLDATHGALDAPPIGGARLALAAAANPARGAIQLRLDALDAGDVRVTLYDVGGRAIAERRLSGPARTGGVRFDGLPPGLYFAVAGQRGAVATTRVAIVR